MVDLADEALEDDPTSFCFECGFDAMLSGMIFTKLMILTTGDFDVSGFPKYALRWKNMVCIPQEIGSVLYDHEISKNTEPEVAGSSSDNVQK